MSNNEDVYAKQYEYTNVVDMVLSNQYKKPEHHTLFIDARTGESLTLYGLRRMTGTFHAALLRFGLKRGDAVCTFIPNNVSLKPAHIHVPDASSCDSPPDLYGTYLYGNHVSRYRHQPC